MLAVVAIALFVLAGFDAHFGDVTTDNLVAFGLAALAAHLLWTVPLPGVRRRP